MFGERALTPGNGHLGSRFGRAEVVKIAATGV
jgi:hypothetical protein